MPYAIELKVSLQCSDMEGITPNDVELHFGPAVLKDKIDTWLNVYGIDERYKAKLCSESDGKYWLTQVLDEWEEDGREPADYLRTLKRQEKRHPYAECSFLKVPFLDACYEKGVVGAGRSSSDT